MARPKAQVDPNQVEQLGAIGCTNEEIAAYLGVSHDVIERRFECAIKKGRLKGHTSLKRKQYEVAMSGNVGMLIWLGKQYLGQREPRELEEVKFESKQEAVSKLRQMADRLEKEILAEKK